MRIKIPFLPKRNSSESPRVIKPKKQKRKILTPTDERRERQRKYLNRIDERRKAVR